MAHDQPFSEDDFSLNQAVRSALIKQIEQSGKFNRIKKKLKLILNKEIKNNASD